jgi:hypothetical protein
VRLFFLFFRANQSKNSTEFEEWPSFFLFYRNGILVVLRPSTLLSLPCNGCSRKLTLLRFWSTRLLTDLIIVISTYKRPEQR